MSNPHVVLVTPDDQVIGQKDLTLAHHRPGLLHRAVSVFVFNSHHQLLLQKRSSYKPLWPLYWTNTCCTHPQFNQTNLEAAALRLKQEMGLVVDLTYQFTFKYQADYNQKLSEHELDAVFFGTSDQKPILNPQEAADYRYLSYQDLTQDLNQKPDQYTPWLKLILKKLPSF